MTATVPAPGATGEPGRALPQRIPQPAGPWGAGGGHPDGGFQPPPTHGDRRLAALPTLVALVAVLGASTALSTVVSGGGFFTPLVEVIAVIWLLGVGCRLLRAPTLVVVLVQFAGLVGALTGLFATTGWWGFIPNASVFTEAGDLLAGAWDQILANSPPAPSSVQLSFLICLSVGVTALIVDFLVAEAQAPALVALPLLCLYSVPASIAQEQLPWWTFALPAVCYALLLALTGRLGSRVRGRATAGVLVSALAVAGIGTAAAVVAGDSITAIGTEGRLPRSTEGGPGQIGLSPFTSLANDLRRSEPLDLLRVSGMERPDYLRTVALSRYAGGSQGEWVPSELVDDGPADGTLPGSNPSGDQRQVQITSQRFADRFLPSFLGATAVEGMRGRWRYDAAASTVYSDQRQNPGNYTLRRSFATPTVEQLEADSVTADPALVALPIVPELVKSTAERVTANATTPFAKADALRRWFTDPANGFRYSLQAPATTTGDPLTDFLTDKQGYCEHYASTMAVMLRTLGIPTRVAVGFTQGTQVAAGTYQVTTNDAHAWVEVRFNNNGWVRFDPTPLVGGQGNEQGFSEDAGAAADPAASAAPSSDAQTSEPDTSVDANNNAQLPDGGQTENPTRSLAPTSAVAAAGGADDGPTGLAAIPAGVWWTGLGLLVLAGLAAAPGLVRRARRGRRLRTAAAGGPAAATSAWEELEDVMRDHGLPVSDTESSRELANRLARTSRLTEQARLRLKSLVLAAEREWYGGSAAVTAGAGAAGAGASPNGAAGGAAAAAGASTGAATAGGPGGTGGDSLATAVDVVSRCISQSAPLSWWDRLVPRSVRPVGWS